MFLEDINYDKVIILMAYLINSNVNSKTSFWVIYSMTIAGLKLDQVLKKGWIWSFPKHNISLNSNKSVFDYFFWDAHIWDVQTVGGKPLTVVN